MCTQFVRAPPTSDLVRNDFSRGQADREYLRFRERVCAFLTGYARNPKPKAPTVFRAFLKASLSPTRVSEKENQ
jgi:hypothetical protein